MELASATLRWRLLAALPMSLRRQVLYRRAHGRFANLRHPRTFTEKINYRMLHDRRPLIAMTCDKLAVKDYARNLAVPGLHLPETYWVGRDLSEVDIQALPDNWVLKPNHRSGLVHFGDRGSDMPTLERSTRSWLGNGPQPLLGEWAYSRARRLLLIEELLGLPGIPPTDYKFLCFHGEPLMVQVDSNRFSNHGRRLYDPAWTPLSVKNWYAVAPVEPAPALLGEMLQIAKALSAPFDFIRVDLYADGGRVLLGELTPYPGGALEPYQPVSYDEQLGSAWAFEG